MKRQASMMHDPVSWVANRERQANELGRGSHHLYANHRQRLSSLVMSFGGAHNRVCLLGAGNCNDIDLVLLAERFAEIDLVDIDQQAVEQAISRQPEHVRAKLKALAPVDVSGLFAQLPVFDAMDAEAPAAQFAEALVQQIHSASNALVARLCGPYDLVVSCCVSTQLSWTLTELLTKRHLRLESFRLALLMIHLRLLLALRKPKGGAALWVTDVSSSTLCPLEEGLKQHAPAVLLDQLVQSGAVYSGGNPAVIARIAAAEGVDVKAHEPWLWRTRSRSYLVQALEVGSQVR